MEKVNIYISGHNDFPCPAGRTVEEVVNAIRSGYGLLNGGIDRNGVAMFPNDVITADGGDYHIVNFQSLQAPLTAVPPAPVPIGNSFQPLIRAVVSVDSKFLAFQQSLKAVPLPPDVNQLKLFLSGDASLKIPLPQSFYENLLQSPH